MYNWTWLKSFSQILLVRVWGQTLESTFVKMSSTVLASLPTDWHHSTQEGTNFPVGISVSLSSNTCKNIYNIYIHSQVGTFLRDFSYMLLYIVVVMILDNFVFHLCLFKILTISLLLYHTLIYYLYFVTSWLSILVPKYGLQLWLV
jgi:hypothetical protein